MQVIPINKRALSFDSFTLKMIAIIAMVIDHAGYLLFDNLIIMRIVGRLTIPIMAFFITEGYRRTHNIKKYMIRLTLFGVLSILPYYLAFGSPFNILFNLLFGLIVLVITDKLSREWQRWCIVIVFAFTAFFIGFDGMYTTVPMIYLMNKYREDFKKMAISVTTLLLCISLVQIILGVTGVFPLLLTSIYTWIRPFASVALLFIYGYNGQRGKDIKHLFYIFYPAHLLVLYFLTLVF